jgi:3-oxoacyl-[acyl-carrier protein] reductase
MIPEHFLKDKVAVVTGGSRGIGEAIVIMLAQMGCHVAFSYHHSEERASRLEKEIRQMGVQGKASQVDSKDFKSVQSWIGETHAQFDRLDILVNNAGIIIDKALMLMTSQDWQEVIETNLTGTFNATRACIVSFMKQKKGDIINISSVSGVIGLARQTNYSASKGGINSFTKALAKEVAFYGVRVNAVAPGFIDTDILSGFSEDQKRKIRERIPLGRLGTVQDVTHCVKFLLSPQAQYMTGQVIAVDGGLVMR